MYVDFCCLLSKMHMPLVNPSRQQIFDKVQEIKQSSPQKLVNWIGKILQIIQQQMIITPPNQRRWALALALDLLAMFPSMIDKNQIRFSKTVEVICLAISFQITHEIVKSPWFLCEAGQIQEKKCTQSSEGLFLKIKNHIEDISQKFNYYKLIQHIDKVIFANFCINDWKFRAATVMFICEVSLRIPSRDFLLMNQVVEIIKLSIRDKNLCVIAIALEVIFKLSQFYGKRFKQNYLIEFLPEIMIGNTPATPYFWQTWLKAIFNILQQCQRASCISPDLVKPLMQNLCFCAQNGDQNIRDLSLLAINSLVDIRNVLNPDSMNRLARTSQKLINQAKQKTAPKANPLIGKIFKCLTLAISSQYMSVVNSYITPTISCLKSSIIYISPSNFFICFKNLCFLEQEFQGWKGFYEQVLSILNKCQMNEMLQGINAIKNASKCFERQFQPYVNNTLKFLARWMTYNSQNASEMLISEAIKAGITVISRSLPEKQQNWNYLVENVLLFYFNRFQFLLANSKFILMDAILYGFQSAIVYGKEVFKQIALLNLFADLMIVLQKIKQKRLQLILKQSQLEKKSQFEDYDNLNEELNNNQQCNARICNILFQISRNVTDPSSKIVTLIEISNNLMKNSFDYSDLLNAASIIKMLIQGFEYKELKYQWANFESNLYFFCTNQSAQVRYEAICGLILLIKNTPYQLVTYQQVLKWFDFARKAYQWGKLTEQTYEQFQICRQKSVNMFGRIVCRFYSSFNLKYEYRQWLHLLPLSFNPSKQKTELENLCSILLKSPCYGFQQEPEININILQKVFWMIGLFLQQRSKNMKENSQKKIAKRIKTILLDITSLPIYKQNKESMGALLTPRQKEMIEELLLNEHLLASMSNLSFEQ